MHVASFLEKHVHSAEESRSTLYADATRPSTTLPSVIDNFL
jgi:hypothetical protein